MRRRVPMCARVSMCLCEHEYMGRRPRERRSSMLGCIVAFAGVLATRRSLYVGAANVFYNLPLNEECRIIFL